MLLHKTWEHVQPTTKIYISTWNTEEKSKLDCNQMLKNTYERDTNYYRHSEKTGRLAWPGPSCEGLLGRSGLREALEIQTGRQSTAGKSNHKWDLVRRKEDPGGLAGGWTKQGCFPITQIEQTKERAFSWTVPGTELNLRIYRWFRHLPALREQTMGWQGRNPSPIPN